MRGWKTGWGRWGVSREQGRWGLHSPGAGRCGGQVGTVTLPEHSITQSFISLPKPEQPCCEAKPKVRTEEQQTPLCSRGAEGEAGGDCQARPCCPVQPL